jgi:hypothetical protein
VRPGQGPQLLGPGAGEKQTTTYARIASSASAASSRAAWSAVNAFDGRPAVAPRRVDQQGDVRLT